MTLEELETRKEKAINLLNTHADKYRLLYADIVKITDPTDDDLATIRRKRDLLQLENESIHNQICMLNELEYYIKESEKTSE